METSMNCGHIHIGNYGLGGRGAHLVIPSILGPILAAFLVFNRVYWRIALVHQIGLDDICVFASLVFLTAHCTVNLVAVDHGYGRAQACLSAENLYRALQMFYLDQIFYKFTINLTKLSVLFLYLRIFSQRWFRNTCYACVAVVSAYAVSCIFATVFQCTPVTYVYNKHLKGDCINITAFWYANAIYNIVTDFVILASVPGVVWSLSLTTRQRVGLTLVFGLGIFVFATSILRFTTLDPASKAHDTTFGTLKSTMWTTIEASTAVVCACLPMIRTPVQKLFPRLFPTRYATDTAPSALEGSLRNSKSYEALRSPTWQHPNDLEMGENRRAMTSGTLKSSMARDARIMAISPPPPRSEDETTVAEEWSPSRRAPKPPAKG